MVRRQHKKTEWILLFRGSGSYLGGASGRGDEKKWTKGSRGDKMQGINCLDKWLRDKSFKDIIGFKSL